MVIIVQKYGGSSVKDVDRILNVARRVLEARQAGNRVVVVLSAMQGETDRLIQMAHQISEEPLDREVDALLATGEHASIALLAIAINKLGCRARSYTGLQAGIITDGGYRRSRIKCIECDRIKKDIENDVIPIVAGFQGINEDGDVTTIGRGGSDISAVALAAALNADYCEIYSDVEGVYTADPKICPSAKKIDRISYEEMLEIAGAGAKVLESRSVQLAAKYNIPIHARSSLTNNDGTWLVKEEKSMEDILVSAIALTENEAKVAIRKILDEVGAVAKLFAPIANAGINVDMIVQNVSADGFIDLTFTCLKDDLKKAMQIADSAANLAGAEKIEAAGNIAKVSVVGVGMKSHAGIASKIFDCLAKEKIAIQMISTSEIKVSIIVDAKCAHRAVNILHDTFQLNK